MTEEMENLAPFLAIEHPAPPVTEALPDYKPQTFPVPAIFYVFFVFYVAKSALLIL